MNAFTYHRAQSLAQAASALAGAPDGRFVAGGQSLLGAIKLVDCNVLITNEATARELLIRRRG